LRERERERRYALYIYIEREILGFFEKERER